MAEVIQELSFREAINAAMKAEARADDKVVFLGEDIGAYGGFKGQDVGLLEEFGPERVRDCPMAEAAQIGVALGLATGGWRPVVEIMFAEFLPMIADELANWAAMMHKFTDGRVSAPLTVRTASGIASKTSHPQLFEAWFAGVPGIKVVAPSSPKDAYELTRAAIRDPNPVLVYEQSMLLEDDRREPVDVDAEPVRLRDAAVVRPGTDVTLVAHSLMARRCLDAAELLAGDGISAEVVDMRVLSPLPVDDIVRSVASTGALVVVQEDWPHCSIASEVIASVVERGVRLTRPPIRITGPDAPVTTNRAIQAAVIPNADAIRGRVTQLLSGSESALV